MIPDRFEGNRGDVPASSEGKLSRSSEGNDAADGDSRDLDDIVQHALLASVDSFVWQRLVEDRLDEEQYHELLVTMEARPSLWRECALAFLEEQALRKSLVELRQGTANSRSTDPKSESRAAERNSIGHTMNKVVRRTTEAADAMNRNGMSWKIAIPIMAAAAGFLLTLYSFSGMWRNLATDVGSDRNGSDVHSIPVARELAEFKDYLADLSVEQRQKLFELSSERPAGTSIQAQPVSLSPGRLKGNRRFVFYRTTDGGQIIVPVDDYQYVTHDFQ